MASYVFEQLRESRNVVDALLSDWQLQERLAAAAVACIQSLKQGSKILLVGNGGSAADAQHIAAELVGRFAFNRPGLAAVALTTDSSVLTAVGNDYGHEFLFSRQVQALGRSGDVLIAYSTSGKSANILHALAAAREIGLATIGLTGGTMGPMAPLCEHLLSVPSPHTAKIQECHLILGHILCGLIERGLFGSEGAGN